MARDVEVRATVPGDRDAVIALVRAACRDETRDGSEEVQIVEQTWARGDDVHPIDLVAVIDAVIVGHVLGASGTLDGVDVFAVAPLAVAPSHQSQGIGSSLMRELLRRAEAEHWPMVLLLGNPAYYGRFGFEPSGPLGITSPSVGVDDPHFQVRRLSTFGGERPRACRATPT